MKKFIISTTILFLISLAGCTELNSNFDCPMKPGVHCESLDQVNAHIDSSEVGTSLIITKHQKYLTNGSFQRASIKPTFVNDQLAQRAPMRYPESVMHIWIAPFEDQSGNYYLESEVYSVVTPGHWVGDPQRIITKDEE